MTDDELFGLLNPELKREGEELDLGAYDNECLEKDILVVSVKGVRLPIWRVIEGLLYVKDQDTDEFVPFKLRWGQKLLYKALLDQALNGKPMRQDILKARQLGFSTLIAAIIIVCAMFRPNTKCVVLADIEEHASNIFEIYQAFYEHLDDSLPNAKEIHAWEEDNPGKQHSDSLKPIKKRTRAGKMMVFDNGSRIQVIVAGDNSGRSGSYTIVHSSETAFQPDLIKTNRSLFKTVSINNRHSMIFIETTANGYNDYKTKRWDLDAQGKTVFNPLFVPWFKNRDYVYEVPASGLPQVDSWIYAKWKQHPEITKEQIMWYWMRFTEDGDVDGMLQEFPWDPSDAFISSGRSAFDTKLIKKRLDELIGKDVERGYFTYVSHTSDDGQTISMSEVRRESDNSGEWKFFILPRRGRHYVVSCDPTKGINTDKSAIVVTEQNTSAQCAVFNAKGDIEEVAKQLYCAGIYYNTALLSSELNTGPLVIDLLLRMGYPNLYVTQQQSFQDYNESIGRKYGHDTNRGNRDYMISSFAMAFRNNYRIINDIETLQQMETFQGVKQKSGLVKYMASGSAHDDIVMAYCATFVIRQQQDFDPVNAPVEAPQEDTLNSYERRQIELMNEHRKAREEEQRRIANNIFVW